MKNFIVLLALVSFVFIAKASDELNYVSVGDVTYFSDEVKVGSYNVRIATDNGLIIKAPLKDVDAYMVNGRIYERMPLICKDGKEKCTELMELVSHRNGLRLYKCYAHTNNPNLGCCFYDKEFHEAMYFVYKEGKLYLRIDKENAETVLPFFRVDFKGSN